MMKMAHIIKSINQRGDQKVNYCNNNNYYHPIAYTILFVALNALIRKLDERVKKSESVSSRRMGFLRHGRRLSEPCYSTAPSEAPSWAVQSKSLLKYTVNYIVFRHHNNYCQL